MKRLVLLSVAMTMAILVAACGLPDNDDFQSIDQSQDGFGLGETSTTSTTTPPTTTIDVTTSSTIDATTSTIAPSEPVTIYFPIGQQLTGIQRLLPLNPSLSQVIAYMLAGPEPESAEGVRLLLPQGEEYVPNVTLARGVAVVDFPEALFENVQEMSPLDQRLVFGQIVLTLCERPGVGQVKFERSGEGMLVFRGDGTSAPGGELVSADDYTELTGSAPATTTTTTATSVEPPPDPTVVDTSVDG
jgi:hypothetical protein